MKVLSCIGKKSQDGTKTFYNTTVEKDGQQTEATAFEQLQVGEILDDSRLIRNKADTGWLIKSANRGGGKREYIPKDEDITTARTGWMCATDLVVAGKIDIKDMSSKADEIASGIKHTFLRIKPEPVVTSRAEPVNSFAPQMGDLATPPPPDDLFEKPPDINLSDLELVDWSQETQSNFLNTLVKVSVKLGWLPPQVKAFLKENFKIADSRGITISMRNDVMKKLIAEAK